MLDMKITITAADLAAAINNLAAAIEKRTPHTVCNQNGNDNKHIDNVGTVNIGAAPAPQAPVASAQPAAPAVPTAAPQYTLEMIATAGSALIDAGKLDQLMALLGKYGVDSLTNLAPENYGAIAQELRTLGARI